ncbi:MAG: hypothetical protein FWH53_09575 [Leptospirales bacterium]|nr:hypothetical protein [Leptospirales bacterium]
MSIKPIDLQTNMGQMSEVSKYEQIRQGALIAQQNVLDMEANENSIAKNNRLDESEKGERTSIQDENKRDEKYRFNNRDGENKKKEENSERDKMKDEKMGNNIDIFK